MVTIYCYARATLSLHTPQLSYRQPTHQRKQRARRAQRAAFLPPYAYSMWMNAVRGVLIQPATLAICLLNAPPSLPYASRFYRASPAACPYAFFAAHGLLRLYSPQTTSTPRRRLSKFPIWCGRANVTRIVGAQAAARTATIHGAASLTNSLGRRDRGAASGSLRRRRCPLRIPWFRRAPTMRRQRRLTACRRASTRTTRRRTCYRHARSCMALCLPMRAACQHDLRTNRWTGQLCAAAWWNRLLTDHVVHVDLRLA